MPGNVTAFLSGLCETFMGGEGAGFGEPLQFLAYDMKKILLYRYFPSPILSLPQFGNKSNCDIVRNHNGTIKIK